MATEPRYSYDPVTQTYTRVDAPIAPEEKAASLYKLDSADAESVSTPNTPAGSAGMIGDLALGLGAYSELGPLAPGSMVAGFGANVLGNIALDQQAQIDADIAAANLAGVPVATTSSVLSGNAVTTNPQTIAGLQGLAAMNAAQNAQSVQNAQAAQQVATVAEIADMADAEAGAAMDAGVSGAANEASHAADGNDPGSSGSDGASTDPGGYDAADPSNAGESSDDTYYKGGRVMNYAQGGIADAAKTQSMGRGPDTMLVHMSPKEVQGLQALAMAHGGSLTINPKTGLPEAGFLDSILPMVAGAALTGISGGLINPMTAGLLVGGGTALFTGDLGKGFMAGLGAFGGAGIGAGLAGAGASTTAGQVITPATANATQVAAQPVVSTATSSIAPDSLRGVLMSNGTLAPQTITPAMNQVIGQQAAQTAVQQAAAAPTMSGMGTGIQNLVTGAPGAGSNFMTAVGGPMGLAKYGGAAAAPLLSGGLSDEGEALPTKTQYIRPYKYDAGRQMDKQGFKYRTGAPGESTSELTYFTPTFTAQPVQTYKDYMSQNMAAGGIASMAKGRYLKGNGDGMSDDIPATIEGGQPARLADGEFVVPADVVSHLGNGSSNAGAKKLYKMMDRIRTARTGKTRQAPEVKTEKYMPA